MNEKKVLLLLLLFNYSFTSFGQIEDSTIITKFTENFVEIKSTREVLSYGYSDPRDSSAVKNPNELIGTYTRVHLEPHGPKLENGVVVIKDRNNNILELKYYVDSVLVHKDFYTNNIIETQTIFSPGDTSLLEKHYHKNGKLKSLYIREKTGLTTIIDYSEAGEIIGKVVEDLAPNSK